MRKTFTAEQLLRARHSLRVKSLARLMKGEMRAARMLARNDTIGPYLSVQEIALQLLLEDLQWQLREMGLELPHDSPGAIKSVE
jgi:hypothetical protein